MFLLFDVGGTKIRLAVSQDGKTVGESKIVLTSKDFEDGMKTFKEIGLSLLRGEKVVAVVGGMKGVLDKDKAIPHNTADLPGWENKPLKKTLEKIFNTSVYIENDAALAGLGEAVFGAGKGKRIVAYLTISTGVGGVRICDGRIDTNSLGFEPGHQVIDMNSKLLCGCGGYGHLEAYIGGASIERQYKKKGERIKDPQFWNNIARLLAYGLTNTIVHWSPHVVVLGGSLMQSIPIEKVRFYLKEILTIFPTHPPIKVATLGDVGALYGALTLLKNTV